VKEVLRGQQKQKKYFLKGLPLAVSFTKNKNKRRMETP
jgi:hypothetical protein